MMKECYLINELKIVHNRFLYIILLYISSGFKWQPSGHLIVFAIQADDDYNLNSQTHSETFYHCVLLNVRIC